MNMRRRDYLNNSGTGYFDSPERDMKKALVVMYENLLTELCIDRYKWRGLPPTIDPAFLEKILFRNGLAVFFQDPNIGYLALQGSTSGRMNMQDNPMEFTVYGNEYMRRRLTAVPSIQKWTEIEYDDEDRPVPVVKYNKRPEECIPIWGKTLRNTDLVTVRIFAQRLAEADTTVDISIENMRQPVIVATDADSVLAGQNLMKQIKEGARYIEVNAGQTGLMPVALDMGVSTETPGKVQVARNQIMNMALSMLGIDNSNQDKKERLVADEVDANNAFVATMRAVNLNARRKAAHQINKRFGLNISVEFHDGIDTTTEDSVEKLEENKDEFIYDEPSGRD